MKFRLFVSLSYVFVCVCVFVCLVFLFVLLCISITLSEQVNDFAFSGIFVEESIKNFQFVPDIETTSGLDGYAIKKNAPVHRIGLHMGSLLEKVIEA